MGDHSRAGEGAQRARPSRQPRALDAAALDRAARWYLERYAASAGQLRRVLERRVLRAADGTDRYEAGRWIEALIARYLQSGLLDDARYAEAHAAALARRGGSARSIRARLHQKGIAPSAIIAALDGLGETPEAADRAAAIALARRRRLGPFRTAEARAASRERDLAAMARAGFAYDLCRAVVDAEGEEAVETGSE